MYHRSYSEFLISCLFIGTTFVSCQHINDTYRLVKDKLAYYDRTIRPSSNQSEPTVVTFAFTLISLHELDEVKQTLSVVSSLLLAWRDDMMKWTPEDYGYLTTFQTESGRFWTPNLILSNNADAISRTGADWQPIRFISSGWAYYFPTGIFSVSCTMDVAFYPWDTQACILSFTPQGYPPSEMRIESTSSAVDITYYNENGAWGYIESKILSFSSAYYSSINVFLVVERKPRFVIVNVLLPIMFMSFLSVLVFLIPPDSGERISYTITMLLAIAVFLTLVGDNLPKTSSPMPIFSYFLIAMLATSICITLATIITLRLYYADDNEPVPRCLTRLVTCCRRKKRPRKASAFNGLHEKKCLNSVYVPDEETCTGEVNGKVSTLNDTNTQRYNGQPKHINALETRSNDGVSTDENDNKVTWKDVSAIVDIFFLVLFFLTFVAATVVYFVVVVTSKRQTLDEILATIEY